MKIIKIINEKYSQNNYLVISDSTAVLIDASASVEQVEENLRLYSPKPKLKAIMLTHCHFDHIQELDNLVKKYACPVYIFETGKKSLYNTDENASFLDEPLKIKEKKLIKTFKDSQEIVVDDITITCYNTPGHTVDSSCFMIEDNLFTGDTVFKNCVGRTDLVNSNQNMQKISLERILNTISLGINNFYAGHGSNFDKDDVIYNINHYLGE